MGNKEVGGNSGEQAGVGASKFDTLSDMPPFNADAARAAQAEATADDGLNGWGAAIENSDKTINDQDQANRIAAQRDEAGFRQVLAQETERAAAERDADARFEAEFAQALKQEESENKHFDNLVAAEANQDALRAMSIDELRSSNMAGARQEIERRAAEMPADNRGDMTMSTVRSMEQTLANSVAESSADDGLNGWGAAIENSDKTINDQDQANRVAAQRGEAGFRQVLAQEMERADAEREANARFEAEFAQALKQEESENKHFDNLVAAEANQDALRAMSIDELRSTNMAGARQELERRAAEMPEDTRGDLTMDTVRQMEAATAETTTADTVAEAATAAPERQADGSYDWKDPAVFDYFMKNDPKVIRDEMPYGNQALRNATEYGTTGMAISPDAQTEPAAWTDSEQKQFDNMVAAEANQDTLRAMSIDELRNSKLAGARQELERRAAEMPEDTRGDLTMATARALEAVKTKKEAEEAAASAETAEAEDNREMWERALDDPDYMTALANKSTKAIQKILGTKQHPRDALEKLLMRAYGAVGEGDANTQKRDREKLAKIGANYEAYLNTLNNGAEALAEVIAAETTAETGENMTDLRAELMGKLGEHADLLDDEEGTIRNLSALDAAGLQALLDKVNARLAEKGAGETAMGDFVTPNGTIFEGMRVPTSDSSYEMSTTAPVETVVDGDTAPAETVADGDAAVAEVAAEDNTALIAEAEQVSPGLFERIKAAFKEPGFLKRIFSRGSIRKAVDGWLANRRANAAEARIAEAPVAETSTFGDESVRNKLMGELIGADGAPGIISGNEAFFNGRPVPTEDELKRMPLSSLQNLVVDLNVYKNLNSDTRSGTGTNVSGAVSAGEASA